MRYLIPGLVVFILLACCGCAQLTGEGGQDTGARELEGVEVREYEGEDLSRVDDVRDVSIKGPQNIDIEDYRLEITGLVENSLNLTYDEVLSRQKYSKGIELQCVEGWSAKVLWEGVLLEELLDEAGVKPEANTVIFHAKDGYTSSLSLFYIRKNDILLAHKINNVTLPPAQGFPFMLAAEQKWGYKWVKWITRIELSDDSNYRGYWERRGYSNTADIDGSFT